MTTVTVGQIYFGDNLVSGSTNFCLKAAFEARDCIRTPTAAGCCAKIVSGFRDPGCFCNKAALLMLGTTRYGPPTQTDIATALGTCGSSPPVCTNYGKRTYSNGICNMNDEEIDFYRFVQGKKFSDALLAFGNQIACFDYIGFKNTVASLFNPTAVAYAGQGLGTYSGIDHIAEYFSLLAPKINKGFLKISHSTEPTAVLKVSPDGGAITMGFWVSNVFANGTYSRVQTVPSGSQFTDYLEMTFNYNGCELRASSANVPANAAALSDNRNTGVVALTEMLYRTVNFDTYATSNPNAVLLGITGICKQHSRYCTGSNSQFASEDECITYMKSLPRYSSTCGTGGIASGNSVTCRAKHQFMAAISPEIHCPHLGRASQACLDSKCENPGNGITTLSTWATDMTNSLTNYAANMANEVATTGQWTYSNYCSDAWVVIGSGFAGVASTMTQVWAWKPNGYIYKWDGKNWNQMPGIATQVAICPDDSVYHVNSAGNIFAYVPSTNGWSQLSGGLTTIACGNDGQNPNALYGIAADGKTFYLYSPNNWVQVGGILNPKIGSIAVGNGKVWGINAGQQVYNMVGYNGVWAYMAERPLKSIAAGPAGIIGLDSSDAIYRHNGITWQQKSGQLRIAAVNDIFVYGVNVNGDLFQKTMSTLEDYVWLGNDFVGIATNNAQTWAWKADGTMYKWGGQPYAWSQIPGRAVQVAICPNDAVYRVDSAGDVFSYNPATNDWYNCSKLAGIFKTIACGNDGQNPNALYGINSSGYPYYYTGPNNWVLLDGILSPTVGSIAVGSGRVLGINISNVVYYRITSTGPWIDMPDPTRLKYVSASNNVQTGLDVNGQLVRWNGINWAKKQGTLAFAAVNDYNVFAVNAYGGQTFLRALSTLNDWEDIEGAGAKFNGIASSSTQVWAWNSTIASKWNGYIWIPMAPMSQIAICPNEAVYGVNPAGQIFSYNLLTNAWSQLSGLLSTIACGNDGKNPNALYGIAADGKIFYLYSQNNWVQVGGTLSPSMGSIAVGYGKVWGISTGRQVYNMVGYNGVWNFIPVTSLKTVSAGNAGAFGTDDSGKVYRWSGSNWVLNSGWMQYLGVSDTYVYGINILGYAVRRSMSTFV